MICRICDGKVPDDRAKCPHCGCWTFSSEAERPASDGVLYLSDVQAEVLPRLDVGPFNGLFGGGGIVNRALVMLGGAPGCGKSTLTNMLAGLVLPTGKVLKISAEEAPGEVLANAQRVGVPRLDRFAILDLFTCSGADFEAEIRKVNPRLVIVDSLQAIAGRTNWDGQEQLLVLLKRIAISQPCPIIVISHINGDGDLAGAMTNQHATDANIVMAMNGTRRSFEVLKNRHGSCQVELELEMTATGLAVIS